MGAKQEAFGAMDAADKIAKMALEKSTEAKNARQDAFSAMDEVSTSRAPWDDAAAQPATISSEPVPGYIFENDFWQVRQGTPCQTVWARL